MESKTTRRQSITDSVMAATDRGNAGDRLIIADVSRDDAWISIPSSEAIPVRSQC